MQSGGWGGGAEKSEKEKETKQRVKQTLRGIHFRELEYHLENFELQAVGRKYLIG